MVYGTIQDGGGNGLVVLNPPERAEPNGAHDIIFIKIIQSPWRRRGTGQCMEQSKMVERTDWLCSPRQRGLSLVGCPLSNIELYYSEPLEETGNGTVYGTIQDGRGNGLVVLTPPERSEPGRVPTV